MFLVAPAAPAACATSARRAFSIGVDVLIGRGLLPVGIEAHDAIREKLLFAGPHCLFAARGGQKDKREG